MTQMQADLEARERARVARKYRLLGYDVVETPQAVDMPEFLHGVGTPDVMARSKSDNVLVDIKRAGSLKDSNDMVGIAEATASHPDWRFELVVADDRPEPESVTDRELQVSLDKAAAAVAAGVGDMAYIYLVFILATIGRTLAERHGVEARGRSDRALFLDLGFKGVVPGPLLERCLSALTLRNALLHVDDDPSAVPTSPELDAIRGLIDDLRSLA